MASRVRLTASRSRAPPPSDCLSLRQINRSSAGILATRAGGMGRLSTAASLKSPKARGVSASVAFDPKDDTLASAEDDKVYLWSPDDGWAHGGPLQAHGVVHQVAWSPDGRYLAAAADDFASVVWDMAHDRKLALSDGFESPRASGTCGLATAFSPDGRLLAMGTSSGVRIWDTSSWQRRTKSVDPDLIVGANVTSSRLLA